MNDLAVIVQVVFVILKLVGVITWSWWIVLIPFFIVGIVPLIMFLFLWITILLAEVFGGND